MDMKHFSKDLQKVQILISTTQNYGGHGKRDGISPMKETKKVVAINDPGPTEAHKGLEDA